VGYKTQLDCDMCSWAAVLASRSHYGGVLHSERVSQIMANGLLEWFPPNRLATFPEFHNSKGIPQEKSYLFGTRIEFGTALAK